MRIFGLTLALLVASSAQAADAPKVNGLLQAWGVNDTAATGGVLNYRLRRAEIKLSGNTSEDVRYQLMVDAAKTPGTDPKILQDLIIGIKLTDGLELTVGQQRTQTTAEGLDPSAELWFPERSLQARTYGTLRSPGAMLQYSKSDLKVGFMASNGSDANLDDPSAAKDLTARADYKVLNELKVGAFARAANSSLYSSNTYGFNTRVKPASGLELRADYAKNRTGKVESSGHTIDLGYQLTDKLQPVVRYDAYTPNSTVDRTTHVYQAGLNYNLGAPTSKVEFAYGITNNVSSPAAASGTYTAGTASGSITTVAFQTGF